MFESKISTSDALLTHQLGATLEMEETVLKMLGELEENSRHEDLKKQFHHHAEETRHQIDNIERAFRALGDEPEKQKSPAILGLEAEGKALIKRTDDMLVDHVILGAAAETEHHEIAVYEDLIKHASAMGADDVVRLLEENLEQEKHTLAEVETLSDRIVRKTVPAV